MGWIADDFEDSERLPVDDLINDLTRFLDSQSGICQGYDGQARKCCDDIFSCLETLKNTLVTIKIIHTDNQDIESACRQVQHQLNEATKCIDEQTSRCHISLSKSNIRTPFYEAIKSLIGRYDSHCTPTTTTTTSTSTTTTELSKTSPSTTTHVTEITSRISSSTGTATNTTTSSEREITDSKPTPSPLSNDDTIIIASSTVTAGIFVLVAIILIVFCLWRKKKPRPCGSDSSANSKRGFIWRWLHTSKPEPQYAESEIYTEIDEAFMEAVYRVSREQPPKPKDRIQHTAQINMCYGTGINDDDIIQLQPETSPTPLKSETGNPSTLNLRNLSRNRGENITSSDTTTGTSVDKLEHKHDTAEYQNVSKGIGSNAVLVLPNKTGFIRSKPAFTAVTETSGAEYVQIEARERTYSEPSEADSAYDTTTKFEFGPKSYFKSSNVYNTLHPYENTAHSRTPVKKQRTESIDQQISPNYIYENPCLEY